MIQLIKQIFQDGSTNKGSSKRFVGVLAAIVLLFMAIYSMMDCTKCPKEYVFDAVLYLTFGSLGLTTIEHFKKPAPPTNTGGTNTQDNAPKQ